jgi:CspA family cold shock protein
VASGTVKFFDAQNGYGYTSRDGATDLFVHYWNYAGSGDRTLEQAQQAAFEVGAGRKGDEAQNVPVI